MVFWRQAAPLWRFYRKRHRLCWPAVAVANRVCRIVGDIPDLPCHAESDVWPEPRAQASLCFSRQLTTSIELPFTSPTTILTPSCNYQQRTVAGVAFSRYDRHGIRGRTRTSACDSCETVSMAVTDNSGRATVGIEASEHCRWTIRRDTAHIADPIHDCQ